MALLAQQELLEAAPSRRLIVPRGCGSWWGCDPGTLRFAVAAVVGPGEHRTALTSFSEARGGQRLSLIYDETRGFVARLLHDGWPLPGLVVFELPAGNPPNLELIYAAGVQQAAVFDAVLAETGRMVTTETMPTSSWKLAACGKGNLYKPTRKKLGRAPVFEDYAVAVWARENGYMGRSYDECDALGLAEAGRRTVALDER